jgi:hypothetical protein
MKIGGNHLKKNLNQFINHKINGTNKNYKSFDQATEKEQAL